MAEGFHLEGLRAAVEEHGRVARVVVGAVEGSAPRAPGAAMLVWEGGSSGTIGGGALEWEATARARALLADGGRRVDRRPLGPALGQCCGGSVTLVTEVWDAATLSTVAGPLVARSLDGRPMGLEVKRLIDRARREGARPAVQIRQGWLIEPLAMPERQVWIWGAGHVGRALVAVLAPLPDLALTWIDVARDRFPEALPEGPRAIWCKRPEELVAHAPRAAEHLVLTFSHALDLELCHRILAHGSAGLGVIGSATKAARFRGRLRALGHSEGQIAHMVCPIGDKSLGKHPQAIALGVAVRLLGEKRRAGAEIAS
ncbi:xanthine dehydrogenase accessory protein XdhC [Cereibacter azotoformans]|uniref:Molybdenum cofactor sulfurylase n=1 Tax=Cereibacter azotoformans TaxID=43057 RepID=A0A2T5K6D8_9RHOB|nr:xanthine dehydrogenase accessory protein XdhC [Cereibacter azotoformans]AXQ95857.1 xanthine dehydrogenase accessory protein XdhC [Cereibacter sphaeroides]PTR17980.1 molybdenum cofactor sulfurylase [Cereibacter azotoformans]UIJ32631.1 xanthine dehydrogenase accessory protein XdhC [Cereibacter azotoformans]